jgi:putative membrane protein
MSVLSAADTTRSGDTGDRRTPNRSASKQSGFPPSDKGDLAGAGASRMPLAVDRDLAKSVAKDGFIEGDAALIRWGLFAAMAIGVTAFVAVLVGSDFHQIIRGVAAIGAALALIIGLRLAALSLAGIAWGIAGGDLARGDLGLLIRLRIVREAINCLLPVAQIGGDLIGGRLLALNDVRAGPAMAGILVDVLLQTVTQGIFAVIGLAVLWSGFGDIALVRELGWGAVAAVPALGGFFLAQRFGLFALVDGSLATLRRFWPGIGLVRPLDLQPALRRLYARPAALGAAALLHLGAWSLGIGEIWLALDRMGAHPGFAEALILESLGQAVRSAGFAVPGALGIQEGGFILLGTLFGLSPASAVALSLVKRLPDFAIGLPGLCYWQALEAALLRRRPDLRQTGVDLPA